MQKMIGYSHADNLNDSNVLFDMFNSIKRCVPPDDPVVSGSRIRTDRGHVAAVPFPSLVASMARRLAAAPA